VIILFIIALRSFLCLVIALVIADLAAASIYAGYAFKTLGHPRFEFPMRRLVGF